MSFGAHITSNACNPSDSSKARASASRLSRYLDKYEIAYSNEINKLSDLDIAQD